jgi:DHA1 family bicyclomycin/chloramphenicol resistance-like MFS transporter
MDRSRYLTLLILLGMLTALMPFSIDPTLSSMPEVARTFGVEHSVAQLSLIVFFLGVAAGQLVVGPLADRYGRRPVILTAIVVYAAAAIGAATAADIEWLIGFRALQGLAACAGQILPRTIIRDRFDPVDASRLLSYVMMIHGIAPVIGPIFGAHLAVAAGWRAVYWFHLAYGGLLLVLAWTLLDESILKRNLQALSPTRIARTYVMVIRDRVFYGHMLCGLGCFAGLFVYLTAFPAVVIDHFGQSGETFGYLFSITASGWMIGNLISARLVGRMGIGRLIRIGTLGIAASATVVAVLPWAGVNHPATIVAPMFVYMMSFSLVVPPAQAAALTPFPEAAGAASSLMGFLQLCLGAAIGTLVGQFDDGSQIPMVTAIGVTGLGPLAAYWWLVRKAER